METVQVANRLIPSIGKARFTRASTGAKKLAPVNMRKEEHQYVIDGFTVKEVLDQIPVGVDIIQAKVSIWGRGERRKILVPTALRKLGVQTIREHAEGKEATFVFDSISKAAIIRSVKAASAQMNMPFDRAYFNYLILSNSDASGRFEHCTKEVKPDERDLRRKLRVLGIVSGTGKVQGLLSQLGAKKFSCTIREEAVKMIMCTRD